MTNYIYNTFVNHKISQKYRKCRKSLDYLFYNLHICSSHAKKDIIKIQKVFRGWKSRKKLEFYKQLPLELWNKILYYIRYQHYIKQYFLTSLNKIYSLKINKLYSRMNDIIIRHVYNTVSSKEIQEYMNNYKTIKNFIFNQKFIIEKSNTRDIIIVN